jgi:hypothetical protein
MSQPDTNLEPDWDTPLSLTITPGGIMHALYTSADSVHTGWSTCIEASLVVSETTALDEQGDNHCRLVEQEYVEDESPDVTWHDWAVELKIGDVYLVAHWRTQVSASPAEWEWCAEEAEKAFVASCVLMGKRVRRGLVIEEPPDNPRPARTRH